MRTIEVLLDQDAIRSGAAITGKPWKYYDLGHGYCTYDFFDQCAHRMACAKCSFYRPKANTEGQLLEGKQNLQRMLQEIPLLEDERAAVEDGLEAMNKLLQRLATVPTPFCNGLFARPYLHPKTGDGASWPISPRLNRPRASATWPGVVITNGPP